MEEEKIKLIYSPDKNILNTLKVEVIDSPFYRIITDEDINNYGWKSENNKIIQNINGEIISILKSLYNPLKAKQDIVIFNKYNKIIKRISYFEIEKADYLLLLRSEISKSNLNINCRKILEYIIDYYIEKDIQTISKLNNYLVNRKMHLDNYIFKLFRKYFGEKKPEINLIEEIFCFIGNQYLDNNYSVSYNISLENCINRKQEKMYDFKKEAFIRNSEIDTFKEKVLQIKDKEKKKKNLIVFHMESISNEIFNNHRKEFKNTFKLMEKSIRLEKFYSSATSSAMSITDFLYGNDGEMNEFTCFEKMKVSGKYGRNLYQELADRGYKVKGIGYNFFPSTEEVNSHDIWNVVVDNEPTKYEWIDDFKAFIKDIISYINKNKDNEFALHIWNLMPHVGQRSKETDECSTFYDRINESYVSLDMTIQAVCECLNDNGILDKTILAGYGDHGDDKWTRSMNAGFTHTIEPYHNIINTPAFIYDQSIGDCYYHELVSIVDLKNTLLYLAGNEIVNETEKTEKSENADKINKIEINKTQVNKLQMNNILNIGSNIFKNKNKYIFSKRLFANQRRTEEIKSFDMMKLHNFNKVESRNQAYAIVSEKYTLMVSDNGMEMFMNQLDPCSYNNILNFYKLNKNGDLISFNNRGAWRGHFRNIMMSEEQVYDMVRGYYELRNVMKEKLARCSVRFDRIRDRGFMEE